MLLVRVIVYGVFTVAGLVGTIMTDVPGLWVRFLGAILTIYLAFGTYRAFRLYQRFGRGASSN